MSGSKENTSVRMAANTSVIERISQFVDKNAGPIFLLPAALLVLFLLIYPIASSLYYSLTDRNLIKSEYNFIGFANYVDVLHDARFWLALNNSIVWTLGSVFLQILLGFGTALLLNRVIWLKGAFRTVLIIPWAFPSLVIAFTWSWLLNDMYGFVNAFLMNAGVIDQPILWLADQNLSMLSMIMINVWFGFPFMMVSILAGLQNIPRDQYESAAIDGASSWQAFVHITLHHVRIIIGLIAILRTIWVFNNFDLIFLTTGGGPGASTETLPLYAYRTGWVLSQLGKASTIATILVIFLMLITFLYIRTLNKWERDAA